MAKYVEQVTHVWNKCKDCPFVQPWYQADGFGMGEELAGYSCKKGYYGKVKATLTPDCIPVWCEFSENKRTGKEPFTEYLDLSDEEILTLKLYLKDEYENKHWR